jgi:hypothetical protein
MYASISEVDYTTKLKGPRYYILVDSPVMKKQNI